MRVDGQVRLGSVELGRIGGAAEARGGVDDVGGCVVGVLTPALRSSTVAHRYKSLRSYRRRYCPPPPCAAADGLLPRAAPLRLGIGP